MIIVKKVRQPGVDEILSKVEEVRKELFYPSNSLILLVVNTH